MILQKMFPDFTPPVPLPPAPTTPQTTPTLLSYMASPSPARPMWAKLHARVGLLLSLYSIPLVTFFFLYLHFLNSLVNLSCWKGKYTLLFFLFLKGNSWPFLSSRYILESANLKFVCICIGSTDQLKESWHFYCMEFFVSMNIAYLCIFKSSLISLNNI